MFVVKALFCFSTAEERFFQPIPSPESRTDNLGLLSWPAEFVNYNSHVTVLQNCFSANLASAVLNYGELRVCFHKFTDGNSNSENRVKAAAA